MDNTQNLDFEQALKRLERLVHELEGGDLSLEAAIQKYQEGMRLSALCSSLLDAAEKAIRLVTPDEDGNPILSDLQSGNH